MQLVGELTFLKLEKGMTKEKQNYLIVSFLDEEQNPCRFFIFDENVMRKLLTKTPDLYQKITCVICVSYFKENWNVSLKDVDVNE